MHRKILICWIPTLLFAISASLEGAEPIYLDQDTPDWQAVIDDNPPGSHFIIRSGLHRGRQIFPKNDSIIEGESGAIMNGCVLLRDWKKTEDGLWSHKVDVPFLFWPEDAGLRTIESQHAQQMFRDGKILARLFGLAAVYVTPDGWYFDKDTSVVYVSTDPTGREMELMGGRDSAIAPSEGRGERLTIRGIVAEKYPTQHLGAAFSVRAGSLIENCEARWNHASGIAVSSATARRNRSHHNGLMGMIGGGDSMLEENELDNNSWGKFTRDWTSGGIKIVGDKAVMRRNYCHHNFGPGIWFDIESLGCLTEENICEWNEWEGILFEVSSDIVIQRNVCRWNASSRSRGGAWGAQICVQNGANAKVISNYVETNGLDGAGNGLVCINQGRGSGKRLGVFYVHDCSFTNNTIVSRHPCMSGFTYGTTGFRSIEDYGNAKNVWASNTYIIGDPSRSRWLWYTKPSELGQDHGSFLSWKAWRALGQDANSVMHGVAPDRLRVDSAWTASLIEKVVGFDPEVRKATFRAPPDLADADKDDLPDSWEREHGLAIGPNDGGGDADADGLSNAAEFRKGSDPKNADTDFDGLPDSWEDRHLLPISRHSSAFDPDDDGLTNLEEYEEKTDPAKADPVEPSTSVPADQVELWYSARHGVDQAENRMRVWRDLGPKRGSLGPSPSAEIALVDGSPAVRFKLAIAYGGANVETAPDGSFTLMTLFRRSGVSQPENPLTHIFSVETYLKAGLRLGVYNDSLMAWSSEGGGSMSMVSPETMASGAPYLVTLVYHGDRREMRLALNGKEQGRVTGAVLPGATVVTLGGVFGGVAEAVDVHEFIWWKAALRPRQRQAMEQFLGEIYLRLPKIPRDDLDFDGMPDAYEAAHGHLPDVPDAANDNDFDGVNNITEFKLGLNPNLRDTDGDGLSDGNELALGTAPRETSDFLADTDGDGVSDAEEVLEGTQVKVAEPSAIDLPWEKLRLWFRQDSLSGDQWRSAWGGKALAGAPPSVALGYPGQPDSGTVLALVQGAKAGDPLLFLDGSIIRAKADAESTVVTRHFDEQGSRSFQTGQAPTFSATRPFSPTPAGLGVLASVKSGAFPRVVEILYFEPGLTAIERIFVERLLLETHAKAPATADSDADGLPDWYEIRNGSAVGQSDSAMDSDGDGETDLLAFRGGGEAFRWTDSNQNGIHDAWDSRHRLASSDEDGDGLNAYEEFVFATDPAVRDVPRVSASPTAGGVAVELVANAMARHERYFVEIAPAGSNAFRAPALRMKKIAVRDGAWIWRAIIPRAELDRSPAAILRIRVEPWPR